MGMPWADWEFWVATAIAAAAVVLVLRPVLAPFLSSRKGASDRCPGCPSGAAAARPKRADLTVGGKRVG